MVRRIKNIDPLGIMIYFFMAGVFLLQTSCISLRPGSASMEPANAKEKSPKGRVFISEDYIVYRAEGNETPTMLAKIYLGDKKRAWVIEDENKETPFKKGQHIVIPLKDQKKGGLSADGYQVIPILSYHSISEKCKTLLCMSKKAFEQQMKYLQVHKYRVITLKELLGFLQYRNGLPERSVVITFDDGYRSFYKIAFPILKKYGYKAALFVYTDFIDNSKNALTWNQLRKLKAHGFEIGSHGLSHSDFTKKRGNEDDQAYIERIKNELIRSKKIIDKKLMQDTVYVAFPFGNYNQKIMHLSENAGFKIGLSLKSGSNPFFADPLSLKRNQIMKKDMKNFTSQLNTFYKFTLE